MATIDRAAPPAAQARRTCSRSWRSTTSSSSGFWFTDILGQLKSFAVGTEELEDAFEEGMGFDGSSITGFNRIEESDMIAMPDPDDVHRSSLAAEGAGRRRGCSATS